MLLVRPSTFFLLTATVLALPTTARGQPIPKPPSLPPPSIVKQVGIDQKLDQQLPLDLTFRDESGNAVRLGDNFPPDSRRPVVLALVYYRCPSLCTMALNGMGKAFKVMSLDIGKDYDVICVSIDPTESPSLAQEKKQTYVKQYGRPTAENGWHFLTGEQSQITALADAVGFRYVYDENTKQYAHSSAIMVATPQGRLSRYLYGLEYSAKDLRLALVEASNNKIGSLADQVMLLCFQYDPMSGKYGFAVMTSLRVIAVLTMLAIGGFVVWALRRERRQARAQVSLPHTIAIGKV